MDRNVEMFLQVEKALVQSKCLVMPQIYIQQDVDKLLMAKLRDIVKRHQGVLVDDAEAATHIVYPIPQNQPTQDGERVRLSQSLPSQEGEPDCVPSVISH